MTPASMLRYQVIRERTGWKGHLDRFHIHLTNSQSTPHPPSSTPHSRTRRHRPSIDTTPTWPSSPCPRTGHALLGLSRLVSEHHPGGLDDGVSTLTGPPHRRQAFNVDPVPQRGRDVGVHAARQDRIASDASWAVVHSRVLGQAEQAVF